MLKRNGEKDFDDDGERADRRETVDLFRPDVMLGRPLRERGAKKKKKANDPWHHGMILAIVIHMC